MHSFTHSHICISLNTYKLLLTSYMLQVFQTFHHDYSLIFLLLSLFHYTSVQHYNIHSYFLCIFCYFLKVILSSFFSETDKKTDVGVKGGEVGIHLTKHTITLYIQMITIKEKYIHLHKYCKYSSKIVTVFLLHIQLFLLLLLLLPIISSNSFSQSPVM